VRGTSWPEQQLPHMRADLFDGVILNGFHQPF